jgi:ATP-dependent helicase/nuclease subunit B
MNLYSINIDKIFLEELIEGLLERFSGDHIIFANTKIFLPTKRSCRLFDQIFLEKIENKLSIIPKTYPINDINYLDVIGLFSNSSLKVEKEKEVNDISVLSYLVYKLDEKKKEIPKLKNIPSYNLAQKLLQILKELEDGEIEIENLDEILLNQDYEFLHYFCDLIKEIIVHLHYMNNKKNIITNYQKQNIIYDLLADYWQINNPQYPVIFAGITSYNLKLKNLIKIIANVDNGYVILHNVSLDEKIINHKGNSHPIYPVRQITDHLNISLSEIKNWCSKIGNINKNIFLEAIFWPVELTSEWKDLKNQQLDISNINIIDCEYEIEEAKAIVLICKKYIIETKYKIAVIIKDLSMKKRICNEFKRHNIIVNDTIGTSLIDTILGRLFSLILEFSKDNNDAHLLLAIIKNPKSNIVNDKELHDKYAKILELNFLRGMLPQKLDNLANLLEGDVLDFFKKITLAFKLLNKEKMLFKDWLDNCLEVLKILTGDEYSNDEDSVFDKFITDLKSVDNSLEISKNLYISMCYSMIQNYSCKESLYSYHNIHIVTPEEARMFDADVNILTSLNKDTWLVSNLDQWFNKDIRSKIGLVSNDCVNAQNSLDLLQFLYSKHVYLTWSLYTNSGMQVESKILTKIKILSSYLSLEHQIYSDISWQKYAQLLDRSLDEKKYDIIEPTVSFADKPKELSITQFEKLINNPYAIYAQLILKLLPLDEINKNPMQAEFGTFIHLCLHEYNMLPQKNIDNFNNIIELNLKKYYGYHIYYIWLTKAKNISNWVEEFYSKLSNLYNIYSEEKGELKILVENTVFKIKGKADLIAIDKKNQGNLIIDYKTGLLPTISEIKNFTAVQLLIESLMLAKSAFNGIDFTQGKLFYYDLQYIKIAFSNKNPEIVRLFIPEDNDEIMVIENKICDIIKDYLSENYQFKFSDNNKLNRYDNYLHFSRKEESK